MSFDSTLLKEITFFVRAPDEEAVLYKLGKIGIERKDMTVRSMPPSSLRKDYVIDVNTKDYVKCVNCDHLKISHEKDTRTIVPSPTDICFGLNDNQNCNCRKFISVITE